MTDRREWIAGLPWSSRDSLLGRMSKVGGKLVLTSDGVTFEPLMKLGRRYDLRLAEIADVSAFAEKPPRLRITPRRDKPVVYAVVPSRSTPTWSDDASARDSAVAAIRAALPTAD